MLYTETFSSHWVLEEFAEACDSWQSYMIAGGAVRDAYYSKPIKDIDVFYWDVLPVNVINIFTANPCDNEQYTTEFYKCTHKGTFEGYTVDFIQVHPSMEPEEVLKQFPCSISQVCVYAFDLIQNTNIIRHTKLFKLGKEQNKIYFDIDISEEYRERILQKYPNAEVMMLIPNTFYNDGLTTIDWETPPPATNLWSVQGQAAGGTTFHINHTQTFNQDYVQTPAAELVIKLRKTREPVKYRVINTSKKDCYKEYNF